MNARKQSIEKVKNEKFWKRFYGLTGFLGLVLIMLEIFIYRRTIIATYIPISIILIIGFLTFYFNRQHYKKTFSLKGNFFPIMQNLISWGFIAGYIFMAINYYLADKTTTEYKFPIKEKSSMSGSKGHRDERQPLITIDFFKFEKQLIFRYADTDKVNKADSIMVKVRKGGLGFDILDSYDVFANSDSK
jgi:heme/copper-type cytochrome/quinol oxidase subunit 2